MTKEPLPLPCAMTESQEAVLMAISAWHPRVLLSADEIADVCERSPIIVRSAIRFLIKEGIAEKPSGPQGGARLTLDGQVVAYVIFESRQDPKDQI